MLPRQVPREPVGGGPYQGVVPQPPGTGVLSGHCTLVRSAPTTWAKVSAYQSPRASTRTGFPRSALTRYGRVGCLLDPADGGALPAGCRARPAPARFPAASPCTPLYYIPSRGCASRSINGG